MRYNLFVADVRFDYLFFASGMDFDFETKEFAISMFYVDNPRFFLRNFQLEPFFEPLRDCNFCLFSRCFCPPKYPEVISVAHYVHFFQISFAHCHISAFAGAICARNNEIVLTMLSKSIVKRARREKVSFMRHDDRFNLQN